MNAGLSVARAQELIDQATEQSKEKSLKTLTNLRFEVAQRERKGGKVPDVYEIAETARKDYEASPSKWRRGKPVLSLLKQLIHQELGKTAHIIEPSPYVIIPDLQKISAAIWPATSAEVQKGEQLASILGDLATQKVADTLVGQSEGKSATPFESKDS